MKIKNIRPFEVKRKDSLPDIDLDFESARRDEVKAYISQKYGRNYARSVGSYTRMKLKGALKDLCRVRGLSFKYVNTLTADIDNQLEYTFKDMIQYAAKSPKLYEFVQNYPDIIECLKVVLNNPSVSSVHPSAVIIVPRQTADGTPVDVYNWLPIKEMKGLLVTEWEGKYTDRAGMLKEDILSINQLDKFKYMLKLINLNHEEEIDLNQIELDDERTYELFQEGHNTDIFQFNGYGLRKYSREVRPDCIEDLIAMNALYRPGPMESKAHTDFALIKHGEKSPEYDYGLKEVTLATSGLYVYQEQIMKAVHVLGGLTLSEADEVRTVMKKFDKVKMATFKNKFLEGAVERGCEEDEAHAIWAKLERFSRYGFNRSHAAAYGLISYWSQWMKANFPLEFWASAFNFAPVIEKIPGIIREIRLTHPEITVQTPDVNYSEGNFVANIGDNSIYWSLLQIKGVGPAVVRALLKLRADGGKFYSLEEFMSRAGVKGSGVNKGHIRSLILSGAFDQVAELSDPADRLDVLMEFYALRKEDPMSDEIIGLSVTSPLLLRKNYFWLLIQRELIGYADIDYRNIIKGTDVIPDTLKKLFRTHRKFLKMEVPEGLRSHEGEPVLLAGFLQGFKEKPSKRGPFGILELENNTEIIEVLVWSEEWTWMKQHVERYQKHMVAVNGLANYDSYRKRNSVYCTRSTQFFAL